MAYLFGIPEIQRSTKQLRALNLVEALSLIAQIETALKSVGYSLAVIPLWIPGPHNFGTAPNYTTIATDGAITLHGASKLPYGSMFCEDATVSIVMSTTSHTYKKVPSGLSDGGTSSDFTFTSGHSLVCHTAGRYLCNWSLSLSNSVSDVTIEGGVLVNDAVAENTANATRAKENGVVYSVGGSGIVTLAVDDVVTLGVEKESAGAATITVNHANLTLLQVGG